MLARPFLPVVCNAFDDGGGIEWTRQGAEGMGPCQRERERLALFDFEIGHRFEVLAAEPNGRA
jgi:hypothetical protein